MIVAYKVYVKPGHKDPWHCSGNYAQIKDLSSEGKPLFISANNRAIVFIGDRWSIVESHLLEDVLW
jgi:hypothetical protein